MKLALKPGIDFCICTFNRVEFLKMNVDSLLSQWVSGSSVITVVDNNSTDGTKEYIQMLVNEHKTIRYIAEYQQGLSFARNRGWKESEYEWIYYLDDDCVVPQDFPREAISLIEKHHDLDALGGPVDPLFVVPPPEWLPTGFGSFSIPSEEVITLEKGYLRGNNFLIRKSVLSSLGGFNTSLGMSGKTLKYAEELELQYRMRISGYQIGYAPSLRINHYVRTEKISLGWLLRSEYAKRRDKMVFDPVSLFQATLHLTRTMISRLFWVPLHFATALLNSKYTWRNAMLDAFLPLAHRTGEWIGAFQYKFN